MLNIILNLIRIYAFSVAKEGKPKCLFNNNMKIALKVSILPAGLDVAEKKSGMHPTKFKREISSLFTNV